MVWAHSQDHQVRWWAHSPPGLVSCLHVLVAVDIWAVATEPHIQLAGLNSLNHPPNEQCNYAHWPQGHGKLLVTDQCGSTGRLDLRLVVEQISQLMSKEFSRLFY